MSSYVFMKVLESAPERYDLGIRLLSGGAIGAVRERVAGMVAAPGRRVLDIGCGTGDLSLACAALGADVVGIDIDAGMLAVARGKTIKGSGTVEWVELGAMEIEDRFEEASFDAMVSTLAFSELTDEEQSYVLRIGHTRLRPGGLLVIADEIMPDSPGARLLWRLRRLPTAALTYLITQTTTRPVEGLSTRVRQAGFIDVQEERTERASFIIVRAKRGAIAA